MKPIASPFVDIRKASLYSSHVSYIDMINILLHVRTSKFLVLYSIVESRSPT